MTHPGRGPSPMPPSGGGSTTMSPRIPTAELFHRPQWSIAVEQGCRQRGHYLIAEDRRGAGRLPAADRDPLALVRQCAGLGRLRNRRRRRSPTMRRPRTRWSMRAGTSPAPRLPQHGAARRAVPQGWTAQTGVYADFSKPLAGGRRGDPARDEAARTARSAAPANSTSKSASAAARPIRRCHYRGLWRNACAISARRSSREPCSRRCSTGSARMPTS